MLNNHERIVVNTPVVVVLSNVVAILPASKLSDRIGRKPLIFAACAGGAVGTAILGIVLFGESANPMRLASLGLIIVGIIGLKLATPA